MGFSTLIASIILMTALIIAANISYSTLSKLQEFSWEAYREENNLKISKSHTAMNITNVTYNATLSKLYVYIKNTGSSEICVDKIEILLDGVLYTQNISSRTVNGDSSNLLLPLETVEIVVDSVSTEPSRIKVVSHNGISTYWGS